MTAAEQSAIARFLQAWQLGETSNGSHLQAAADRYPARADDPDYPSVIALFIREEPRHGELLGQFLDLAGVGPRTTDWGDSLFRWVRYCITDMEVWTTPVVMVETLAMIYWRGWRLKAGGRNPREAGGWNPRS